MKNKIFLMALATVALAACSNDEVTSVQQNEDAIGFRTLMNNSRGQSTTTSNLDKFWVTARTDANGVEFADKEYVKNSEGNFVSATTDVKTWPKYTLNFFAVTPDHSLSFDEALKPKIKDFQPNLTIRNQVDLIYATNKGERADFASTVPLKFNHALAQIEVKAKNTNASYVVYVKGYRIGYVDRKGTFTFPDAAKNTDNANLETYTQASGSWSSCVKTSTHEKEWGNNYSSEHINPGYTAGTLNQGIKLGADATKIFVESTSASDLGEGNAIIIPQDGAAWSRNSDTYKMGRYLALLVQINYLNPDGSEGAPVYPAYAKKSSDTDKSTRVSYAGLPFYYGYAAVPVADTWEAGKKYTYILDFSEGCGYVDPEQPKAFDPDGDGDGKPDTDDLDKDGDGVPDDENGDGIPDGIDKDGKPDTDGDGIPDDQDLDEKDPFNPGDEIIGHNIMFKVIVSDWVEISSEADATSTINTQTTGGGGSAPAK